MSLICGVMIIFGEGGSHTVQVRLAVIGICLTGIAIPLSGVSAQTSVKGIPANRPDQMPVTPPAPAAPPRTAPAVARQPDAPITPFTLTAVQVDGSGIDRATLASAYRPYIGRTVDNAALVAITTAVAALYGKTDIALYTVLVPQQDFAGGKLRLTAVEGYVGAVEVRGDLRKNRLKLLRAYLRRLQSERPLQNSTLQRMVSLIRDMPGLLPDISLVPGTTQGAVRLVINAREKPVQVAIGANDRGTALLGRTQVQADALVNGIFGGADQLRLTSVLPTKVSRFQYVAGSYSTPLNADGTTMTGNLSYLRTRPSAFPLKGDAVSFGLQVSHPIIRSYTKNLYATIGLDGINSNNALLGFTLSNDRVRTLRTALSFTTASTRNQFTASATGSFGLDILGARFVPGLAKQRFRKLNVKVNNGHQIGKSFIFRLNAFAQVAPDDLPSSEHVALGGDEFGRAYEAALISGDTGYAGSAELAWRPQSGVPKLLAGSELYTFADGGKVRYRSRFGLPAVDNHLRSVGAGVRMQIANRATAQLEAARGLDNPVFYKTHKKTRLLFSIRSVL